MVDGLWELFGSSKQVTPLALYHRLIQHIKEEDPGPGIERCVSGFATFFRTYSACLSDSEEMMKTIPRDTVIRYGSSKNVYLEIQKYLYKARGDNREIIRQHLLTISAIIEPSEAALAELDAAAPLLERMGLNDGSKEGEFVTGIMQKAKSAMENVETDDPSAAIMGLFSSGIVTDMVQGLQSGVQDGTMDMNKLLGSMQGALASVMPPPQPGAPAPSVEEVQDEKGKAEDQ